MSDIIINKRQLFAGTAAVAGIAAGGLAGARPALAKADMVDAQVPGLHRMNVGEIQVTAVLDGFLDIPTAMFPKADAEGVAMLQKQAFKPVGETVRGSVNTYVVNTGDRLILIDSGGGGLMGPNVGKLHANLEAAGIDPSAIDTILVTHLHIDHVGGLYTPEGSALFPDAEMVVSEADVGFWSNNEIMAKAPDNAKGFFTIAQDALKAYEGRIKTISGEADVAPGISAMPLPGHTPGHTGFVISSGDDSLFVWGDIVHSAALQFARPDWSIAFDIDQDAGAATRKKVFDMTATDRLTIAGMHLPYPGIGHVAQASEGYAFVPEEWQYKL
jgi:glyoxylase-like metal-dependent hydrolase (beta-lactamase superfamily II)